MATVDGSYGVDDVLGGEGACSRDYSLAGRQTFWPLRATYFQTGVKDGWPTSTMYRSIDAATAHQRAIGCIDNGVYGLRCEVSEVNSDQSVQVMMFIAILHDLTLSMHCAEHREAIDCSRSCCLLM